MARPECHTLSGELRLVPCLDAASVGDLLREELFPSEEPRRKALADGQSHWERVLTDQRVVPLSLLTAPHVLRDLLRQELDASGGGGEPEPRQDALLGGHALFEGERLVLTHGCCSDLRDSLWSWDAASRARQQADLAFFDIGHNPDMFATWEAPWLVLNEADENAPCALGEVVLVRQWRLPPQALEEAVRAARREQEAFAHRLEPYLAEGFPPETVPGLAATLAGLR